MLENRKEKYDIVISNPPYISEEEEIEPIVRENEPHLALYAKEKGLYFYRKILSNISKNLKNQFLIAFEIGCTQKEEIIKIANTYLNNIQIICQKDLQNRDRMLFIISNSLIK